MQRAVLLRCAAKAPGEVLLKPETMEFIRTASRLRSTALAGDRQGKREVLTETREFPSFDPAADPSPDEFARAANSLAIFVACESRLDAHLCSRSARDYVIKHWAAGDPRSRVKAFSALGHDKCPVSTTAFRELAPSVVNADSDLSPKVLHIIGSALAHSPAERVTPAFAAIVAKRMEAGTLPPPVQIAAFRALTRAKDVPGDALLTLMNSLVVQAASFSLSELTSVVTAATRMVTATLRKGRATPLMLQAVAGLHSVMCDRLAHGDPALAAGAAAQASALLMAIRRGGRRRLIAGAAIRDAEVEFDTALATCRTTLLRVLKTTEVKYVHGLVGATQLLCIGADVASAVRRSLHVQGRANVPDTYRTALALMEANAMQRSIARVLLHRPPFANAPVDDHVAWFRLIAEMLPRSTGIPGGTFTEQLCSFLRNHPTPENVARSPPEASVAYATIVAATLRYYDRDGSAPFIVERIVDAARTAFLADIANVTAWGVPAAVGLLHREFRDTEIRGAVAGFVKSATPQLGASELPATISAMHAPAALPEEAADVVAGLRQRVWEVLQQPLWVLAHWRLLSAVYERPDVIDPAQLQSVSEKMRETARDYLRAQRTAGAFASALETLFRIVPDVAAALVVELQPQWLRLLAGTGTPRDVLVLLEVLAHKSVAHARSASDGAHNADCFTKALGRWDHLKGSVSPSRLLRVFKVCDRLIINHLLPVTIRACTRSDDVDVTVDIIDVLRQREPGAVAHVVKTLEPRREFLTVAQALVLLRAAPLITTGALMMSVMRRVQRSIAFLPMSDVAVCALLPEPPARFVASIEQSPREAAACRLDKARAEEVAAPMWIALTHKDAFGSRFYEHAEEAVVDAILRDGVDSLPELSTPSGAHVLAFPAVGATLADAVLADDTASMSPERLLRLFTALVATKRSLSEAIVTRLCDCLAAMPPQLLTAATIEHLLQNAHSAAAARVWAATKPQFLRTVRSARFSGMCHFLHHAQACHITADELDVALRSVQALLHSATADQVATVAGLLAAREPGPALVPCAARMWMHLSANSDEYTPRGAAAVFRLAQQNGCVPADQIDVAVRAARRAVAEADSDAAALLEWAAVEELVPHLAPCIRALDTPDVVRAVAALRAANADALVAAVFHQVPN